jgi:hypothetical protein
MCVRKKGEAMAKKRTRKQKRHVVMATDRRGRFLAIGLLLSLFIAGGVFAQWHSRLSKQKQRTSSSSATSPTSPTPMNLNPGSPSKEYIYGGGRMVATEEPPGIILAAPTNLRATTISSTQIHLAWGGVTGAVRYELQRSLNYTNPNDHGFTLVDANITSAFRDDTIGTGAASIYRIRAFNANNQPSPFSNIDVATAIVFVEDPVSNGMMIKEVHVTQLRQGVDALRIASGLPAATWADPPPLAQIVNTKKLHIDQLRANLDAARAALTLPAPIYTDATITQFITPVKAAHIQELRRLIKGYLTYIDQP